MAAAIDGAFSHLHTFRRNEFVKMAINRVLSVHQSAVLLERRGLEHLAKNAKTTRTTLNCSMCVGVYVFSSTSLVSIPHLRHHRHTSPSLICGVFEDRKELQRQKASSVNRDSDREVQQMDETREKETNM